MKKWEIVLYISVYVLNLCSAWESMIVILLNMDNQYTILHFLLSCVVMYLCADGFNEAVKYLASKSQKIF